MQISSEHQRILYQGESPDEVLSALIEILVENFHLSKNHFSLMLGTTGVKPQDDFICELSFGMVDGDHVHVQSIFVNWLSDDAGLSPLKQASVHAALDRSKSYYANCNQLPLYTEESLQAGLPPREAIRMLQRMLDELCNARLPFVCHNHTYIGSMLASFLGQLYWSDRVRTLQWFDIGMVIRTALILCNERLERRRAVIGVMRESNNLYRLMSRWSQIPSKQSWNFASCIAATVGQKAPPFDVQARTSLLSQAYLYMVSPFVRETKGTPRYKDGRVLGALDL